MSTLHLGSWTLQWVNPVHLHRDRSAPAAPQPSKSPPAPYRDPTPTPGAFEPPIDLFQVIARGGRALE